MTKKPLPRAHLFNIISIVTQFALFSIFGLAANGGTPFPIAGIEIGGASGLNVWISNIVVLILMVLLNWYWMGVTARFSNM